MSIQDKVNRALSIFAEVRNLREDSFWDQHIIEALNEAYELDNTGLTTFMILRGLTEKFLSETTFSADDILREPVKFSNRMQEFTKLQEVLNEPEVAAIIENFTHKVVSNAKLYGAPLSTVEEIPSLLADGLIRRDSLRSLENLEAHQFIQGKPETDHLNLNRFVWEFWNVNSLVMALRNQPSPGITLALIRDPGNAFASFFVFGIKNGETVTILTDRDEQPHPLHNAMSRRPDRDLNRRELKHWFPYRLLDLDEIKGEDSEGNEILTGYAEKKRSCLVPYNTMGVRLCPITELTAPEFLWLMLTAERIDELYGKYNHKLPQLSYTGEMVVYPYALASPESSIVKSGQYTPLELPHLTSSDVTESTTAEQWEGNSTGFNSWIEERYRDRVPDNVLNVVGEGTLLALGKTYGVARRGEYGGHISGLTSFSSLVFGTEDAIRRDVVWHARYNQAYVMQNLMNDEYEATKDEVLSFWKEGVAKRRKELVEAAAKLEFSTMSREYTVEHTEEHRGGIAGEPVSVWGYLPIDIPTNLVNEVTLNRPYGTALALVNETKEVRLKRGRWWVTEYEPICPVNGKKATLWAHLKPDNPLALADILGITIDELPWQLKHWYGYREPYDGNSILDRLDPLYWVADSPWNKLEFSVAVGFSRSGFNLLRKRLGLPKYEEVGSCMLCNNGKVRPYHLRYSQKKCPDCGRKLPEV